MQLYTVYIYFRIVGIWVYFAHLSVHHTFCLQQITSVAYIKISPIHL